MVTDADEARIQEIVGGGHSAILDACKNRTMTAIRNFFVRVRNLVVHEFPVLLAVVIAAANAATDHSVKGYAVAVAVAALRFAVSPAFEQAALKQKIVDPKLVESVLAAINARQTVATAFAADSFNGTDTNPVPVDPTVVAAPPA